MFVSSLTIKNYKCFDDHTVRDFNVPDGSPGGGLNILIGENGTGKTALLDAINFLTDSSYTIENRISIHDFGDVEEPIEVSYKADSGFLCDMPPNYRGCYFEAVGSETIIKSRERKRPNRLLSPPYSVSQGFTPSGTTYRKADGSDSGKTIEAYNRSRPPSDWKDDALNVFLFDKNRSRHLTQGTFRTTFERICDDLNWKFLKEVKKDPTKRKAIEDALGGDYFALAKDIAQGGVGDQTAKELADFLDEPRYKNLRLDLVNYLHPFETGRLAVREEADLKQILAKDLGSGIEVIIALLMLKNVASASKGKIIYLIDEPEAHLHPKAQQSLLELLIDESKEAQVFLSTHSPYMFKNSLACGPGLFTFRQTAAGVVVENANEIGASLLPWGPTWGEISFRAYDLATVEFHNELYGYAQEATKNFREKELDDYLVAQGLEQTKAWKRLDGGKPQAAYPTTLPTYVRNSIHHPENDLNASFTDDELAESIEALSAVIAALPPAT